MDKKETGISEWINRDSFNYPYECKKCGFSALPLSIVVTFIYSSYKHNKISNWFIVVCVICSLYKIILNLLGAIFLGEDGRT